MEIIYLYNFRKMPYERHKEMYWKWIYKDTDNFISNELTRPYKEQDDNIDFHINKINEINIKNVENYPGAFRCRFFYGIFDFNKQKGWIKLHGTTSKDFLIQAGLIEEGYFDVNIGKISGIYGDKRQEERDEIRYKNRFTNKSKEISHLKDLAESCVNIGFSTDLIEMIFGKLKGKIGGDYKLKQFFYTQLKLLKNMHLNDPDRKKLKKNHYDNPREKFEEFYGYTLEEKYQKKYKMMLKYIGKENKTLLYSNYLSYQPKWMIERRIEEYKKDNDLKEEWGLITSSYERNKDLYNRIKNDFLLNLDEISNTNNLNFSKRVKFIKENFKKLFPNEKFHG